MRESIYLRQMRKSHSSTIDEEDVAASLRSAVTVPKKDDSTPPHTVVQSRVTVDGTPKRKLSGEQVMQKAALFEKLATAPTAEVREASKMATGRLQFITLDESLIDHQKPYNSESKLTMYSSGRQSTEDVADSGVEMNHESSISPSRSSRASSSPRSHSSSDSGDHAPMPARRKIYAQPAQLNVGVDADDHKWQFQRKETQKILNEFKVFIEVTAETRDRGFGFTLKGGREKREPLTVETVIKGSPADKAGVRIGDVLMEVDGDDVRDQYLTKVNPAIREALKIGDIEIRLMRISHSSSFSSGRMSPTEEPQLSPRTEASFKEKRSFFELVKDESNTKVAKNRRHSAHTNALATNGADKRKARHRSVDTGLNRSSKRTVVEPQEKVAPTVKPCYNEPPTSNFLCPTTRPATIHPKVPTASSIKPAVVERSSGGRATEPQPYYDTSADNNKAPNQRGGDYRVTTLHEERSVGRITDFVPDSERDRSKLFSLKSNNQVPQPFNCKPTESEDFHWRRERERVLSRVGPASQQPLKPSTVTHTPVKAETVNSVTDKNIFNVDKNVFIAEKKSQPHSQTTASQLSNGVGSNSNSKTSMKLDFLCSKSSRDNGTKLIAANNGTSSAANDAPAPKLSIVKKPKSPVEAAKTIEKWLAPRLNPQRPNDDIDFYEQSYVASSPNIQFVIKPDHELGVTSVKRYDSPPIPVKCPSAEMNTFAAHRPTSTFNCPSTHTVSFPQSIAQRAKGIVQCSQHSNGTSLNSVYPVQKSSSSHQICYGSTLSNALSNTKREKLKQFTYQIAVQDPRKTIARPVPVRQERSILIVRVRHDDDKQGKLCKLRKEEARPAVNQSGTGPVYRVEKSQSTGRVTSNNASLYNISRDIGVDNIQPSYYNASARQPVPTASSVQQPLISARKVTPPPQSFNNILKKSDSDFNLKKSSLNGYTTPVEEAVVFRKNATTENKAPVSEPSIMAGRKLSMDDVVQCERLARKAMNEPPMNIDDTVSKMRPPSPKFPVANIGNEQNRQEMIAVSDRQLCSHCSKELGRGAAMSIESLGMFFHVPCFKCFKCNLPLGDGAHGADVRVRGRKLHCDKCYNFNENNLRSSAV